MADIGSDDRQKGLAAKYSQLAMTAIEHALPRGTRYVVIVQGPGFNTYGANVDTPTTVEFCRELQHALQQTNGLRG